MWVLQRVTDILWTYQPYERRVLNYLAALRASLTFYGGFSAVLFIPPPWGLLAAPLSAWLAMLISADFVEHQLRRLAFGYTYNPRVSAVNELEGGNVPPDRRYAALWQAHKFDVLYYKDHDGSYKQAVWEGEPGGGKFGSE